MSATQPPDPVTFFADYCFGLKGVMALRELGFRVEWHCDYFPMDAPDIDWLPEVSQWGWVILSKDKAMKPGTVEFDAVVASDARMFVLARADYTGQKVIDILLKHLDEIVAFVAHRPGPFIVSMSNSGLRPVYPRPPKKPRSNPDAKTIPRAGRGVRASAPD